MKIIFKSSIFILLSVAFFMLQSVKTADCEQDFDTAINNAASEYLTDLANCKNVKLSDLCFNEANLYYEKKVTQAYQTFNSCYNDGKE